MNSLLCIPLFHAFKPHILFGGRVNMKNGDIQPGWKQASNKERCPKPNIFAHVEYPNTPHDILPNHTHHIVRLILLFARRIFNLCASFKLENPFKRIHCTQNHSHYSTSSHMPPIVFGKLCFVTNPADPAPLNGKACVVITTSRVCVKLALHVHINREDEYQTQLPPFPHEWLPGYTHVACRICLTPR